MPTKALKGSGDNFETKGCKGTSLAQISCAPLLRSPKKGDRGPLTQPVSWFPNTGCEAGRGFRPPSASVSTNSREDCPATTLCAQDLGSLTPQGPSESPCYFFSNTSMSSAALFRISPNRKTTQQHLTNKREKSIPADSTRGNTTQQRERINAPEHRRVRRT